jgi:hypothetical protein
MADSNDQSKARPQNILQAHYGIESPAQLLGATQRAQTNPPQSRPQHHVNRIQSQNSNNQSLLYFQPVRQQVYQQQFRPSNQIPQYQSRPHYQQSQQQQFQPQYHHPPQNINHQRPQQPQNHIQDSQFQRPQNPNIQHPQIQRPQNPNIQHPQFHRPQNMSIQQSQFQHHQNMNIQQSQFQHPQNMNIQQSQFQHHQNPNTEQSYYRPQSQYQIPQYRQQYAKELAPNHQQYILPSRSNSSFDNSKYRHNNSFSGLQQPERSCKSNPSVNSDEVNEIITEFPSRKQSINAFAPKADKLTKSNSSRRSTSSATSQQYILFIVVRYMNP